jgi:hypothetical protein
LTYDEALDISDAFKKANVKWIIPSDLNLINGVINDLN